MPVRRNRRRQPVQVKASMASGDAFGRLRISNPETLTEHHFEYDDGPLTWNTFIAGGASTTHLPNKSSIQMRCGTSSGDMVCRQSHRYLRYQPGKSQFCALTGTLGAGKANVRQRIGLFDNLNGYFFEIDGESLYIVERSYASGVAVDTRVEQSDWSLNTLKDGAGITANPSKAILDLTKSQIFIIDFQYLGVGRIRYALDLDGDMVYIHESFHANRQVGVYMTTPNLPLRYEIENTGVAASQTDLIQICCAVASEGGRENANAIPFSVRSGVSKSVTTMESILAVSPRLNFKGKENHTEVRPRGVDMLVTGNPIEWELRYIKAGRGTLANMGFTGVNGDSAVLFDVAGDVISGGIVIDSGFIPAAGVNTNSTIGGGAKGLFSALALSVNASASTGDIFVLAASGIGGAAGVMGTLTWDEQRE